MKNKIYKLLSGVRHVLLSLLFTVFSAGAFSQTTYTYNFTGSQQTLALQVGTYSIQSWGGDGYTQNSGFNGRGGYASGILTLGSAQTIYIYVGGLGSYPSGGVSANVWTFNGGGTGYPANNALYGDGGGASDVRTVGGTWDNLASLASRAIVAGGGGAGRNSSYIGGHGGGLTGGTGTYFSPDQTGGPTGGSQTAGGSNTGYTSGLTLATLGKAMTWDGSTLTANFLAGGGGGYYGGASGRVAGGGGSSYIGGVTSGTTIMFGQTGFVANPITIGNGHVIITELCNITLISNATNSLNPSICSGQSLTLTTNAISNYSWSTGATTSSIVVSPTSNTVYGLSATSPSNCTASKSISVVVSSGQPTLAVNTSTNQTCLGKTVTLTATGAVSYTWSNSVVNGLAFSPSVTNTYTVFGQNGCGTTSAMTTVSVSPLPVSIVSTHTAICTNLTATISLTSGATNYTLQPATVVSTSSNFIVSPQSNTTYSIAASDGTCAGSATITVNAIAIPSLTTSVNSGTVCQGFPAVISVIGAQTYSWTTLNQTSSTVTVFPIAPTAYPVVGTNSLGCSNSTSQIIFTMASPVFSINTNQPLVCNGKSATLTAVGNAGSYVWLNGPTFSVSVVSPTVTTAYTVTGVSVSNTCSATKTIQIGVFTIPLAISGNSVVCSGQEVQLTGSGAQNYNWLGFGNFASISVTPVTASAYTLVGTTTTLGLICSDTLLHQMSVNPSPTVNAAASPTVVCSKTEVSTLTATGATSYTWSNSSLSPSTTFTSTSTGLFTYSVIGADANNCTNTVSIQIRVSACTGIENYQPSSGGIIVYPNPSQADFTIKSQSIQELDLINELGEQVMHISLNEANHNEVKISGLKIGIYLLVGRQQDSVFGQKIIISN